MLTSEQQTLQLSLALKSAKCGLWDWDLKNGSIYFGANYFLIAGYEPDEFPHHYDEWKKRVHPEDIASIEKAIQQYLDGELKSYSVEFRFKTKDDDWMWIWDQGEVVEHDADGNPARFIGLHTDITERELAAEALRESEERFRLSIEYAPEAITIYDIDLDCFVDCNIKATELFGCSREEFLAGGAQMFYLSEQPDGLSVVESIANYNRQALAGDVVLFERAIRRANGQIIYCEVRLVQLPSKNRKLMRASFFDITDKKKLLEQRIHSSQLASLGELAAGMAHEINNPITGVINYAQILLNKHPEESSEKEMLEGIIKEGNRVATIVHNLLGFAYKDRDQKTPLRVEDFVNEPLQIVLQQLNYDGIYYDVEVDAELPKIFGNAQKLGQVMLNLISNARYALNEKYPESHPDKILRISARQESDNDDNCLKLTVWDQGCGIPKEHLRRIFNPFFTTKASGTGTGLGLSVSHDILMEHGATISVESEVDQFTKVVIGFPIIGEDV